MGQSTQRPARLSDASLRYASEQRRHAKKSHVAGVDEEGTPRVAPIAPHELHACRRESMSGWHGLSSSSGFSCHSWLCAETHEETASDSTSEETGLISAKLWCFAAVGACPKSRSGGGSGSGVHGTSGERLVSPNCIIMLGAVCWLTWFIDAGFSMHISKTIVSWRLLGRLCAMAPDISNWRSCCSRVSERRIRLMLTSCPQIPTL